ncbi:MAG: redoxin domain-containing protein, partial [Actinomycetota bacterium]
MSQFEARFDEFTEMGAEIVGISVDSHFSHAAFAAKLKLHYRLLSDFNRGVIDGYVGYFEDVLGYAGVARRAVVVIDRALKVRWMWVADLPTDVVDTES